jgi:hypothetical protein
VGSVAGEEVEFLAELESGSEGGDVVVESGEVVVEVAGAGG